MKEEILEQNRKSWDKVAHHFHGVDTLPSYGPFAQTEDELELLDDPKGSKVLELGFGSGHSLKYLKDKGAQELWGIDLSETQKNIAGKVLAGLAPHLFCGAMEQDHGLPVDYFDLVYSIYALGWTTDLSGTLKLIHSYLKTGGSFIFSWDHPLYSHLKSESGRVYLESSYQDEGQKVMENFKGEGAEMVVTKRKLSTYINALIENGFRIERIIESEVPKELKHVEAEISDRYYSLYKAHSFPTTMVIKAVKE
ncbi:class I SAM-dependent methyltransferase [Halobacillus litoralis]|uniref:class I SAM-dependent methyltransferase n=1 Tax=Halobacillus litoralis TaxID=45668 RepID=UPI001CFF0B0D|nr:class I SAM-dependent methyltransferase [Halobacillus litoralis]